MIWFLQWKLFQKWRQCTHCSNLLLLWSNACPLVHPPRQCYRKQKLKIRFLCRMLPCTTVSHLWERTTWRHLACTLSSRHSVHLWHLQPVTCVCPALCSRPGPPRSTLGDQMLCVFLRRPKRLQFTHCAPGWVLNPSTVTSHVPSLGDYLSTS